MIHRKHLRRNPFLVKLQAQGEYLLQKFFWEICKILLKNFFTEHLQVNASVYCGSVQDGSFKMDLKNQFRTNWNTAIIDVNASRNLKISNSILWLYLWLNITSFIFNFQVLTHFMPLVSFYTPWKLLVFFCFQGV